MSLHAIARFTDDVATITLAGTLDTDATGKLTELIDSVASAPVRHIELEVTRLTSISSAAMRSVAVAHQRLGRQVRISFVGANEQVSAAIKHSGLLRTTTAGSGRP